MRAAAAIYHQWLTVHDGNVRLTWNHLATNSTWKSFLQSNQRAICVCVSAWRKMCAGCQRHMHWETNGNNACACVWGSQSDLRHLQPFKTRLTGQTAVEKPSERSSKTRRKRGSGVVERERGNKSTEEPPPSFSCSLRILCQWLEREGFVYVRYYRTEDHLEKVREERGK